MRATPSLLLCITLVSSSAYLYSQTTGSELKTNYIEKLEPKTNLSIDKLNKDQKKALTTVVANQSITTPKPSEKLKTTEEITFNRTEISNVSVPRTTIDLF